MRLSIFADSKFITDGRGNFYSSSNMRKAMLYPVAELFEKVTIVCRIAEGALDNIPQEDIINNPKIEFLAVPFFKGLSGQIFYRRHIKAQAKKAVETSDVCLFRYGSIISCVSLSVAKKMKKICIGQVLGEFGMETLKNPKHIRVSFLRKPFAWWIKKINAAGFRKCDVLCGVTESIARKYAPQAAVVHQLIDSCLSKEYYFPPHQPDAEEFTAIFAGRLNEFKNVQNFLRAAALLKEENIRIKIIIAGDGDFRAGLEQTAEELGIADQVEFTGRIESRKKLWEKYRAANIGFLLSFSEGLPLGAIEPMSVGLPVIAADLDYIRPVITDGQEGFLVNPANIKQIAEKVKFLATSPLMYGKMSQKAFEKSKLFNSEGQAEKLFRLAKNAYEKKTQ
jgi:glycosyltransferase involved in cell wall biosynthesis